MNVTNLSNSALRKRASVAAAFAGVIALGLLAACGSAAAPGPGRNGPHSPPAKARLSVTFIDKSVGISKHWMLRCGPVGGNSPDPAALCGMLRQSKSPPMLIQPLHVMCPMVIVSGRVVIFTGTWYGHEVHRVIIDGGCDLPIFDQLRKMLY